MTKNIFLILIITLYSNLIFSKSALLSKRLLPGECLAQIYTKKYIKSKTMNSSYKGKMHYIYTCDYTCINNDKQEQTIKVRHEKTVYSEAQMAKTVVCNGVKMKEIGSGKSTYYDFSHIRHFYSMEANLKEIRSWAKKNKISKFSFRKNLKIKKIKKELKKIQVSYKLTIDHFKEINPEVSMLFSEASLTLDEYQNLENETLYELILKLKGKKKSKKKNGKNIAIDNLLSFYNLYMH